ncbi:MAG: hypothetical protein L0196_03570 [candidate division Zixibacteria bacterium]|nr:hypothetical protein [candidate division Zixibacteria bacterium]
MRTLIIIICGVALWGGFLGAAKFFGNAGSKGMGLATYLFIALWFLISAGNMWMGVARAGYSVREELPIFLLIFLLPAALALFVYWRFLRTDGG